MYARSIFLQLARHLAVASFVSATTVVLTTSSEAATINRNFMGGSAPSSPTGNGNLNSIFNTAADYWETAILDDIEFDIDFGWSNLADTTLAEFTPITTTGTPERTESAQILFNSNTRLFNWFLDNTPSQNEEFGQFNTFSDDFGGGEINTGRVYTAANADAAGNFDLLTIAIHELGHAFGVFNFYESFEEETFDDDDIDVPNPLPFAGSELPTTPVNGGHLDIDTAVLWPFFTPGTRTLLSEADIVAAAASSGSTQINLNPQLTNPSNVATTAEPKTTIAWAFLIGALSLRSRRKRSQTQCKHLTYPK